MKTCVKLGRRSPWALLPEGRQRQGPKVEAFQGRAQVCEIEEPGCGAVNGGAGGNQNQKRPRTQLLIAALQGPGWLDDFMLSSSLTAASVLVRFSGEEPQRHGLPEVEPRTKFPLRGQSTSLS